MDALLGSPSAAAKPDMPAAPMTPLGFGGLEEKPGDPFLAAGPSGAPRAGKRSAAPRKPRATPAVGMDAGIGEAFALPPGSKKKRGSAPAVDVDVTSLVSAAEEVLANVRHTCEVMKQGRLLPADVAKVKTLAASVKAHASPCINRVRRLTPLSRCLCLPSRLAHELAFLHS